MDCYGFREEMMAVLYGEAEPATRRHLEEHQQGCVSCRDELAAFKRLRRDLPAWKLPFELLPKPGPSAWRRPMVAAALAASVLVGLGGGYVLTGGPAAARPPARNGEAGPDRAEVEALLAAQETRHRREIAALRTELREVSRAAAEEAVLARVGDLIRESEGRQALLVGTSVAHLRDQVAAQRQYDLAQVGLGLSYLDGKAGLDAARTTELVGHVLQATQRK